MYCWFRKSISSAGSTDVWIALLSWLGPRIQQWSWLARSIEKCPSLEKQIIQVQFSYFLTSVALFPSSVCGLGTNRSTTSNHHRIWEDWDISEIGNHMVGDVPFKSQNILLSASSAHDWWRPFGNLVIRAEFTPRLAVSRFIFYRRHIVLISPTFASLSLFQDRKGIWWSYISPCKICSAPRYPSYLSVESFPLHDILVVRLAPVSLIFAILALLPICIELSEWRFRPMSQPRVPPPLLSLAQLFLRRVQYLWWLQVRSNSCPSSNSIRSLRPWDFSVQRIQASAAAMFLGTSVTAHCRRASSLSLETGSWIKTNNFCSWPSREGRI